MKNKHSKGFNGESFKNGLPFDTTLAKNLKKQVVRVRDDNKASLIIIDGGLGEGKTTLSVHVADYIMKEWYDNSSKSFQLDQQYAMGGEELSERLRKIEKIINSSLFEGVLIETSKASDSEKEELKKVLLN